MTNDKLPEDELPVQFLESISNEADEVTNEKANGRSTAYKYGYRDGYFIGATAYAPWKVKYDELQATIDDKIDKALHAERNAIQVKMTEMETGYLKQIQRMADALGKISNIVTWMEETGAKRISELAENALKQRRIGEDEKKEQLIPMAIYRQEGSKTEANQFKDGKGGGG